MRITVQNPTPKTIERGARVFAPRSMSEEIDVSVYQYFEIKAHSKLKVKKAVENLVDNVDKSEPTETDKSPEIQEETNEEDEESTSCPECDFVAKTASGLATHMRAKHDGGE